MYIIYLDSLHPKNKKHKVNKVSFLHSQTTKRKSSGSAITSQGNRGRCRRTKWFPCHHGRRPIAQINLNRKKKKKKKTISIFLFLSRSLDADHCIPPFVPWIFFWNFINTLFHTDPSSSFDSISRLLACSFSVSPFSLLAFSPYVIYYYY